MRLSGIEEKFLTINTEKKDFQGTFNQNKDLVRENKAKLLEIESLNNSLNFLKANITKMQEKLTSEKTHSNKMVLELATASNKLKNREREVSELKVQNSNLTMEIDDLTEKIQSINSNPENFPGSQNEHARVSDVLNEEAIENLEQEIQILRQSQTLEIGSIDLGKNNEILENENIELVEKLKLQMEELYRVKEEYGLLQKDNQCLVAQAKKTEDRFDVQTRLLEGFRLTEESNKELTVKIGKLEKEMESVRIESHSEINILYGIACENYTKRRNTNINGFNQKFFTNSNKKMRNPLESLGRFDLENYSGF